MRLFLYKLKNDTGAAPHVADGVLSLAICKRQIRAAAEVGDWLFGVGARSEPTMRGERLIYVARVTQKLRRGAYYERSDYRTRWDCIYEWSAGRLTWREGSLFHEGDAKKQWKDIGDPPVYANANVLVSEDFRYFGADGTTDYMRRWPNLGALVTRQKQGHRVFESEHPIALELAALQRSLWLFPSRVHAPTQAVAATPLWGANSLNGARSPHERMNRTAAGGGCGSRPTARPIRNPRC